MCCRDGNSTSSTLPDVLLKYKIVIRENTEVDKRISKKINFMIILNKNSEQIKSNAQPLISNFRYLTIYYYQYLMHMLICLHAQIYKYI